ncbi:F-box protein CPR1-like [Telopea speciosissima]|uniref:F-box protein CPR1-like n=1 Tax=Telopea speciosissima TaxID=54955 RepID=UPI001CC48707|nr:F-box protein CPR1-like [Telopea speciosissima]
MLDLPQEIIINILSKMPTKSLIRFRSVCKHWQRLITDPGFIEIHLNQSVGNKSSVIITMDKLDLYSVNYDKHDDNMDIVKLDNPFLQFHYSIISVVGSCNGLLLVDLIKSRSSLSMTFLWNPSTREYRRLPHLPVEFKGHDFSSWALVHHPKRKDYEVVRIVRYDVDNGLRNHSYRVEVLVYILGTDSWRRIGDSPWHIDNGRLPAQLVAGAPHWMGTTRDLSRQIIVSFDVEIEEFQVVELPNNLGDAGWEFEFRLGVLDGFLSLFHFAYAEYLDVWVMKDYGIKESWTKLFTVTQQPMLQYYYIVSSPFELLRNGEILLLESVDNEPRKRMFYDPKNQSFRELKVLDEFDWFVMGSYIGSLVPIEAEDSFEGRQG